MNRILVLFTFATVMAASAFLVACDDDDGPEPQTPEPPAATATATTAAETPPSDTPTLESPTATPLPNETPESECPIEAVVCNLGESLEVALQEGNYGAVADLMQARDETCPGGVPDGAGGPFPLCDGAPAGEVRSGYALGRRYSEGVITDREGIISFLESVAAAITPDATDAHGSGELKLQAVSCFEPSDDTCSAAWIIFWAIIENDRREVFVFSVPLPANPVAPIDVVNSGILLGDEETIIGETGGQIPDLGEVYVLPQ